MVTESLCSCVILLGTKSIIEQWVWVWYNFNLQRNIFIRMLYKWSCMHCQDFSWHANDFIKDASKMGFRRDDCNGIPRKWNACSVRTFDLKVYFIGMPRKENVCITNAFSWGANDLVKMPITCYSGEITSLEFQEEEE